MSATIVIGSQWGDEGKGKVVDFLSSQADYVVRYQGGSNAGHTLIVDNKKTVLHLVPSGILREETKCVIGAGVAINIETILDEIKSLKKNGFLKNDKQLLISDMATVLLPYHQRLDRAREEALKNEKIGTTGKGIGPAYEDRASRTAILFGDLFHPSSLKPKLTKALNEKNHLLKEFYGEEPFSVDEIYNDALKFAEMLKPYRSKDTSLEIHTAIKANKKVLFEGAQGTLLDILHGTYPFVTSSSTLSGSACIGSGIGPTDIDDVVGITKAYTTRVGSGPFPTELHDEIGEKMGRLGKEFGATTGRKRRCGWLDLVALNYSIRINGITSLALMKIDVLTGFDEVCICTDYEVEGETTKNFPITSHDLNNAKPIYKSFKGWSEDLTKLTKLEDFPKNAKTFIDYIIANTDTKVSAVSVGPKREETIWLNSVFN